MKNSLMGLTLLELLISIAIVSALSIVFVPNIIKARDKANDMAANAISRTVINRMASVEVDSTVLANCVFSSQVVTVQAGINREVVNAARPITDVQCISNSTSWTVDVSFSSKGIVETETYTALK